MALTRRRPKHGEVMTAASLKDWRERRGLSQGRLADLLGMGRRQMVRFEDGDKPIRIRKVVRLALYALSTGAQDYDGLNVVGEPVFFDKGKSDG